MYSVTGMEEAQGVAGLGDQASEQAAGRTFIWDVTASSRAKFQPYQDRISIGDMATIVGSWKNYLSAKTGHPADEFNDAVGNLWNTSLVNMGDVQHGGARIRDGSTGLDRTGTTTGDIVWQMIGVPGYVDPEAAKALARRMFLKYLRRPIDEGQELTNWANVIMSNRWTDQQVVDEIKRSAEYGQMLQAKIWPIVTKAFNDLLGHPPSQAQFDMESNNIVENGWDEAGYRAALWNVDECLAYMTGKFYHAWITNAFRVLLGRSPNAGELTNEAKNIHANHWTEAQYRTALSGVTEAIAYAQAQADAAAAEAAAAAARAAASKTGTGTETTAAGLNLGFLKSPWVWVAFAAAGGYYYWTQVKKKPLAQIPYVGPYIGKAGAAMGIGGKRGRRR